MISRYRQRENLRAYRHAARSVEHTARTWLRTIHAGYGPEAVAHAEDAYREASRRCRELGEHIRRTSR